jgi:hypothetical protein
MWLPCCSKFCVLVRFWHLCWYFSTFGTYKIVKTFFKYNSKYWIGVLVLTVIIHTHTRTRARAHTHTHTHIHKNIEKILHRKRVTSLWMSITLNVKIQVTSLNGCASFGSCAELSIVRTIFKTAAKIKCVINN